MSPLRWDVLLLGLVLAVPVLALGMRGDLSAEDVAMRLPWCLAAAWGAVAVLRLAGAPRGAPHGGRPAGTKPAPAPERAGTTAAEDEHTPTA